VKYLLDIIVGARPNFMKVAPIIKSLSLTDPSKFIYRLVHTGQHYDPKLSGTFFKQLNIPEPHVNLGVGSGSHAEQTASIMINYEKLILERPSNLCLVVGDVTSTMACTITARNNNIRVAHVEAGIRSGDLSMPEEINRIVTDSISNYFFTTSISADENLIREGVDHKNIFFVGNTMIDTLLANIDRLKPPDFWKFESLEERKYFVLTLHRPNNVDNIDKLSALLNAIGYSSCELPVIFPVHPRTAKVINEIRILPKNILFIDPQPYLEFNYLVKNSKAVITDSGGITEEATVLRIPCMTLRDSTERPETVSVGTNELIGSSTNLIKPAFDKLFKDGWKKGSIPEKWDGKAANRIVSILESLF
jgi:UDP-N-acetylglucosamine 2-epimerase (non-hydrolysing)